ncbi:ComEC/Rec2 family competence protein [Pedobacter sp.]|uniref:ComEC/Rec2 family competence protein n=1 Tax=Pedobacter sp. TaxID=1411316 RepID=UPI003D7FAAAE
MPSGILILGYRTDLSKETLAAYAQTGTIHALSVSGMHVGIIYLVLHNLLQFMNRSRTLKICRCLLIVALIWCYALLTGCSPSVLRSAFMLSTFIIGKTMSRHSNSYNTMAFSALALLIYQPLLLFDLGFQLSFLSVFGLIYLQPLLYRLFYFKALLADKLWSYTALSIAAQLTTFPLSVYYFHQFPILFLFSNLFILLPVSLIMYIGLLMLLTKLEFLAPLLEYLLNFMNAGLTWIANLSFATISSIWLSSFELILLLLLVIFALRSFIMAKKRALFIAAWTCLALQSSVTIKLLLARQQQKTIVFKLYKHQAVAFIDGQHALLYTDLEPQSAAFQYSIKPCLDLHHVTSLQIKNAYSDFKKINHL